MLIDDPVQATRLCRALISDVQLYCSEALRQGHDVSEAVDEARALFRSRVGAALHPVFETCLTDPEWRGALQRYAKTAVAPGDAAAPARLHDALQPVETRAPAPATPPVSPIPTGLFEASEPQPKRSSLGLFALLILSWVAIGAWLALR